LGRERGERDSAEKNKSEPKASHGDVERSEMV
jgi:hypothetical protein